VSLFDDTLGGPNSTDISRTPVEPLPTLFVSHGAPTLPLENVPARAFLSTLGGPYRGVRAVLCISAHWETESPTVGAARQPQTIHDFYGFPRALYEITYPASGAPEIADRVARLLLEAGVRGEIDGQRGLDHGAWVPLQLMFPQAEVPVLQLSIQHHLDPSGHFAVGQALEPLRHEGVLVIGSGGAVHPLGYAPLRQSGGPDQWAVSFDDWLTEAVTSGDRERLARYRELAPYPERAHPRPDHFMPLLVALGAAGKGARGQVLHRSWDYGDFGMGAYSFQAPQQGESDRDD
jgi:4,5-DOPA dioxygenase extradiol